MVAATTSSPPVVAFLPMAGPGAAAEYVAAVQLAKQAGATVTATASARSARRLRSYGAIWPAFTIRPLAGSYPARPS
jgi:hypothetical protein